MNFEDIRNLEDLQNISREIVWQNFEKLTAFVFEENNFEVKVNTVKIIKHTRRQYDVIARKKDETFLIECKKWTGAHYRGVRLT